MYVLSGSTSPRLAGMLAQELEADYCGVIDRHFPDGERYIRVLRKLDGAEAVVVQNAHPDKKIVELLLLLDAVREAGASHITAVIPYMGYARQERSFKPGEAVSARAIAGAVGQLCDRVITVGIHTEAVLDFFSVPAISVSAVRDAARYVGGFNPTMVIAPDEGARERCNLAADFLGLPCHTMSKVRVDGRTVKTASEAVDVADATVVILDDIISTGGTIASAAKLLKERGATQVLAACTHGLFIEDAQNRLRACDDILCSDTIEGVNTRFSVAPAIARALR